VRLPTEYAEAGLVGSWAILHSMKVKGLDRYQEFAEDALDLMGARALEELLQNAPVWS
jgi:hypothetical protein